MKTNAFNEVFWRGMPIVISTLALVVAFTGNHSMDLPMPRQPNGNPEPQESRNTIKKLEMSLQRLQAQLKQAEERLQALAQLSAPLQTYVKAKVTPQTFQTVESDEERTDRERFEFENSPADNKTKMALEAQFASVLADKRFQNISVKQIDCRDLGCQIELEAQGADASELATDMMFGMENPPDSFSISPGDNDGDTNTTVIRINHS